MANTCSQCQKSHISAWKLTKLRGKYNPTLKSIKKPNLQRVVLPNGKRVVACAKCIKALAKTN